MEDQKASENGQILSISHIYSGGSAHFGGLIFGLLLVGLGTWGLSQVGIDVVRSEGAYGYLMYSFLWFVYLFLILFVIMGVLMYRHRITYTLSRHELVVQEIFTGNIRRKAKRYPISEMTRLYSNRSEAHLPFFLVVRRGGKSLVIDIVKRGMENWEDLLDEIAEFVPIIDDGVWRYIDVVRREKIMVSVNPV